MPSTDFYNYFFNNDQIYKDLHQSSQIVKKLTNTQSQFIVHKWSGKPNYQTASKDNVTKGYNLNECKGPISSYTGEFYLIDKED